MFTKLNLGLMITAPTNYKPFPQGLAESSSR